MKYDVAVIGGGPAGMIAERKKVCQIFLLRYLTRFLYNI
jgi:hypothetical protein